MTSDSKTDSVTNPSPRTERSAKASDGNSPFNRTAQHDAKRAAILSQAAKLFNFKGSRATTLRDIAASLGLTKTSLYYYVKTKEDLIYHCYIAALEHHQANLDQIEQEFSQPMERSSAFFLRHFEDWIAAQEGRAPHIAALLEIAALKGEHREDVEARYIILFKRIRQYIIQGVEEGLLRDCEPTATTKAILGSLDWTFAWLQHIPQGEVMSAGHDALNILAKGLRKNRRTPANPRRPTTAPKEQNQTLTGFNREEQNRLKQEAFFKTGTAFFNRKGFNGTSLDEIAEHLNVSKGAFYYHIKNKEDLLFSCYERSLNIMERINGQAMTLDCSGIEKAEYICRETFYVQNSDEGPLIRYNTITALPIERRREIIQRTEKANAQFGEILNEGIADGSVRPINTFVAQELISGAINAAINVHLWREIDDLESVANQYFDVFYSGLQP